MWKWDLELKADVGVLVSRLRSDNRAFDHPETLVGEEARWDWHFEYNIAVDGNPLQGNQCSTCAHVDGGAELEYRPAFFVRAMNEYWEGQGNAFPSPGLAFCLGHSSFSLAKRFLPRCRRLLT